MAQYIIGTTTFEADSLAAAIAFVKKEGLAGSMTKVKGSVDAPAKAISTNQDRVVTVSCVSWTKVDGRAVRNVHKWTAPVSAVQGKKSCPKHSSQTAWSGHCDCGACTTVAEADACHKAMG